MTSLLYSLLSSLPIPPLPDLAGVFWLLATCALYALFVFIRARAGDTLYAQPLLWVSALLMAALVFADIPLASYRSGGDWLALLLTLATVSIAVPIYENRHLIVAAARPFLCSMALGSLLAVLFAVLPAYYFGLDETLRATLATKSVTTPIAMELALAIGGAPVLAMLGVIFTGNIAVLMAPMIFKLARIKDVRAQGTALGTIGTGIGVAEAVRASSLMGAFAGLAMGVNGVLTGLLLPLFF